MSLKPGHFSLNISKKRHCIDKYLSVSRAWIVIQIIVTIHIAHACILFSILLYFYRSILILGKLLLHYILEK